ncbi:MAG: YdiU family protein [Bdellovibrionales bacterium]|nr:YdiU family protein [Bdellovibrionales bacterium]
MPVSSRYIADPRWNQLDERFRDPVRPVTFPLAMERFRNRQWDRRIGLDSLNDEEWKQHFWEFRPLPQNLPQPLALRYHGHQFLHYNPDLGDGRGFLFAQLRDDQGRLLDLGTKGSGTTPWSRRGDGRLTLKGAVREVLATEMLEALGVNTSKTLSVFETGEELQRNDEPSPTRSAVLVRLSHGHVRIGTFQRHAYLRDTEALKTLVHFSCDNYYPKIDREQNLQALLEEFFDRVCHSVAQMTAQWMLGGFVHGVLNTDNINISGESFDYGPYRFLPYYDANFTAAYFDHNGLYAYGEQPKIMLWNLQQLQACLQLIAPTGTDFKNGLQTFQSVFSQEVIGLFLKKLNLRPLEDTEKNTDLFSATIEFLNATRCPYDSFFFDWFCGALSEDRAHKSERAPFYKKPEFKVIHELLRSYKCLNEEILSQEYFQQKDSTFLLIDDIENIWTAIDQKEDWSLFQNKITALRKRSGGP